MYPTKQQALAQIVADVQKKWGTQALQSGSETIIAASFSPLSTGFTRLDSLLDGGISRGQITELYGRQTSGVATLALKIIACAEAADEKVIYIDPANTFYPKYAAGCGVNLQDLLIVRPTTPTEGIEVASDLASRYFAGVIVLGYTAASLDTNGQAALRRLTNAIRRSTCAFIVLNRASFPVASPFHAQAATQLQLKRTHWRKRWGVIGGYLVQVSLLRHRNQECSRSTTLRFDLP